MSDSDHKTPDETTGTSPHDLTLPLPGYEAPESGDSAPVPETIGPYRVVGKLGHGGMGVVYAAEDPKLKRRVAIKVLPTRMEQDARVLARFEREAQLLAAVNHPSIATIYSLEETRGFHFLTMEYVDGRTLADRLNEGPTEIDEALSLFRQIAQALEAAHREGVAHLDLKPLNIMVTSEGRVKVLDFGLAKARGGDASASKVISGTPGYMSPEQVRGESVDPRTDVWAFGCVMFECLTGRKLVDADSASQRMERTLTIEPDWSRLPEHTPDRLRALLGRCLERERESRLADIVEARREIEEEIGTRRLAERTVPRRPRGPTPNNLPVQLSSFIGRGGEIEEIVDLVHRHRLVTLTGMGGSGKTRLGLEVAERLLPDFEDGVRLVELAPLTDGMQLAQALATGLGLKEDPGRGLEDVLLDHLEGKRLLLVLDNCEHLIVPTAKLAEQLLQGAPGLQVLATTREALGTRGETVYHVPPLTVPPEVPSGADIDGVDGVRLFVERARSADPGFRLTDANRSAVVHVCRRLDGIPLALELAAARIRVMTVDEIARRLDDSFALLSGGSISAVPRHQTLSALIDSSHDLLTAAEQAVFRRLAVFSGGWTLDAAEVVCVDADVAGWEILDLHARLVDKSLVDMVAGSEGESARTRYRMLETVRGYAQRHLEAAGELEDTRNRHRDVFIALAERAEPYLQGFEQTSWFGRLGTEQDNLRVAFETCAGDDVDPELGLRLAGALGRFWMVRGHWSEGRSICGRVLARTPDGPATAARAKTLNGAGNLAFHQGDYVQARGFHEQSLRVRHELGDRRGEAMSLNNLGEIARMSGDHRQARTLYEDSLAIQEAIDDRWGAAVSYNNLGEVAQAQGEFERARELHGRAIALWPELGDRWGMAWSLSNLGFVARGQGNLDEARSFYEQSLAASRELGDQFGVALSLNALGAVAQEQGDLAGAEAYLRESLDIRDRLGDRKGMAESLEAFAGLGLAQREHTRAARLLGAADALRERIQAPLPEEERLVVAARREALSEALGPETFQSAFSSGRALFLEQAVALARAEEETSS